MRAGWVKKTRKQRTKERREICSFLYLLCPGCTLPDVFSYSSDTKHDFATKALIAITSSGDNSTVPSPPSSSSHPLILSSSTTLLQQPMRMQALCPLAWSATPSPGDIHPHIFHSSSSYKVDSPWPLWTDTCLYISMLEEVRRDEAEVKNRGKTYKQMWILWCITGNANLNSILRFLNVLFSC